MTRSERIMNELRLIAQDVPAVGQARLAAGIVYRNRLIAVGTNQRKSHPLQAKFGRNKESIFLHAEVAACVNAINRMGNTEFLKQSTLIVVRQKIINKKWVDGNSCPCSGCERLIASFNIKNVIFTLDAE